MGMFDWIRFETTCGKCGEKIDGFQSKDSICCMYTLNFWEVNNFYSGCKNCDSWVEFDLKFKNRPNRKLSLKDYKMKFRKSTKKEEEEHKKKYKDLAKYLKKDGA